MAIVPEPETGACAECKSMEQDFKIAYEDYLDSIRKSLSEEQIE